MCWLCLLRFWRLFGSSMCGRCCCCVCIWVFCFIIVVVVIRWCSCLNRWCCLLLYRGVVMVFMLFVCLVVFMFLMGICLRFDIMLCLFVREIGILFCLMVIGVFFIGLWRLCLWLRMVILFL